MTAAFKEWQAIVGALAAGEQTLILRKGGIAEGRGGFAVKTSRFWLFPTQFHAQRENTKPAAAKWFSGPAPETITLRCHAELVQSAFLADWAEVARLDPFHLWTQATVRERFDWARPPGLHALVVRVYRLDTPIVLTPTAEMAGCKSWIELPFRFEDHPGKPVLDEAAFAAQLAAITAAAPSIARAG
ncbi:MAG TPA: DUF1802 family protein [Opitutaceae bacterium]